MLHRSRISRSSLVRPKQLKIDVRFGTSDVGSLFASWLLRTVAKKWADCTFCLMGIQNVRWVKCGEEPSEDYAFFLYKSEWKSSIGFRIFVLRKTSTRIKVMIERAVFISNESMYSVNPYVPHKYLFRIIISLTNFNAQFSLFINNIFVTLLSSTCFEH